MSGLADAAWKGPARLRLRRRLGTAVAHIRLERLGIVSGISIIAVMAGVAAIYAQGIGSKPDDSTRLGIVPGRLPQAPPLVFKNVDATTAVEMNRRIPFSTDSNPAAKPFRIKGDDLAYVRALECLTATIYYEAANEVADGQRAVAQVVLNRVRHPAFPMSVCEVTYQGATRRTGCQFTFTCDGALRRQPHPLLWSRARAVAMAALDGAVFAPVGNATHYHANYVVPYWASALAKSAVVDTHIFYRWPGWWGQSAAFSRPHSGEEPDPRVLRHAALRGRGDLPAQVLPVSTDPRIELVSIIDLLARKEAQDKKLTRYEEDVRRHFSGYSDHVAVQIYRQLQAGNSRFGPAAAISSLMHYSKPPDLDPSGTVNSDLISVSGGAQAYEGFIAALRDFVRHSNFVKFYKEQQSFFDALGTEARDPTLRLFAKVERDSGLPVPPVRLLLAPLFRDLDARGCTQLTQKASETWILIPAAELPKRKFANDVELAGTLSATSTRRDGRRVQNCSAYHIVQAGPQRYRQSNS